ncbi:hypothetical protein BO85DRAFT_448585 [Aspergillus piperis CBS 112811]|uniref:Uncharacterized protein n=1 Tax=Aspergillus piperis CBS 112811 TaxID=1448313 RepID=A0A8G1R4L8_9EURO|nr:hypothetical protein BO85DRAFT_448585 [Aspergillus piperis CBS 112811]RAH58576.1 hypothetical protein BO85DRAFT_448585 [Aspergillus piperis CBS 112811]
MTDWVIEMVWTPSALCKLRAICPTADRKIPLRPSCTSIRPYWAGYTFRWDGLGTHHPGYFPRNDQVSQRSNG